MSGGSMRYGPVGLWPLGVGKEVQFSIYSIQPNIPDFLTFELKTSNSWSYSYFKILTLLSSKNGSCGFCGFYRVQSCFTMMPVAWEKHHSYSFLQGGQHAVSGKATTVLGLLQLGYPSNISDFCSGKVIFYLSWSLLTYTYQIIDSHCNYQKVPEAWALFFSSPLFFLLLTPFSQPSLSLFFLEKVLFSYSFHLVSWVFSAFLFS